MIGEDMLNSSLEKPILYDVHIWIVWVKSFDGANTIVAICTTEIIANTFISYLQKVNKTEHNKTGNRKFAKIWKEETITNHLFLNIVLL
jgi:hypothetical protein